MMAALWADVDHDMQIARRHLARAVATLRSNRLGRADLDDDLDLDRAALLVRDAEVFRAAIGPD